MKLAFKTDPELSFYQAARIVATESSSVDPKMDQAVGEAVRVINQRLELAEIDPGRFWDGLLSLHPREEAARVEAALLEAGCAELGIDSLAPALRGRLADARLAFRERFPKLAEQLPLRAGPLRGLWEATGPGLLRQIGRSTIAQLVPRRAQLLLVQPARGGDGDLLAEGGGVWMEAVLSNPHPAIPETLRIAWLIARLGWRATQQGSSGAPPAESADRLAGLALVPITLEAAAELEVAACDDESIETAAGLWMPRCDREILLTWWHQMQQQRLPLPVAIRALEKMGG
jgi:hypothetical protein